MEIPEPPTFVTLLSIIWPLLLLSVAATFACAVAGSVIAGRKDAGVAGFILGFFLAPAGMIAAGFLDSRPQCLSCNGRTNGKPRICPHCHTKAEDAAIIEIEAQRKASGLNPRKR